MSALGPETISLTTSCGFVVPASDGVNLCSAALWWIKYNKQLINHIISAFASHCFLHFQHKCTMAAGHLAAINFTQSGSKKGRQQSGEWRNKEWGPQLCHAILAPLSLSPRATPGASHPSSLSLVQSQWCMTTITEHNDSSARNLLFHCKAKKEEDLWRKRRGDKTTWERRGGNWKGKKCVEEEEEDDVSHHLGMWRRKMG